MNNGKIYLCFAIGLMVTGLQIAAWFLGKDGAMFALTSAVLAGLFGFGTGIALSKKEEVEK
jgi:hypothetical protein